MALPNTKPWLTRRGFLGAGTALAVAACTERSSTPAPSPTDGDRGFAGRVIERGHHDYEHWRSGMPWQTWTAPRHPALIVRPANRAAVAGAVRLAQSRKLAITVKSGGHNVSEAFLRDGGMLLDLGDLQAIEIDPTDKSAWVEPALWSHGLAQLAGKHRLAFPIAHCASVPMGGYLLGGGVGYNGDEWGGIACHSILAAEMVLADGSTVVADEHNHPELLWAVRGAGTGFFAAVTRYKLRLYDLPGAIYENSYFFPLSRLEHAVRLMEDFAATRPAKTELMGLMGHNPAADPATAPLDSKVIIVRAIAFADSAEEAAEILAPAATHPAASHAVNRLEMVPNNFAAMAASSVNASMGLGFGSYAVDTSWTDQLGASLGAIAEHFTTAPSSGSHYVISPRLNPELRSDSAFSRIGKSFVGAYAVWRDATDDEANFRWLAEAADLMEPHSTGKYINEVDLFRNPGAVRQCFSEAAWKRLRELRRCYDPGNRFSDYPGLA